MSTYDGGHDETNPLMRELLETLGHRIYADPRAATADTLPLQSDTVDNPQPASQPDVSVEESYDEFTAIKEAEALLATNKQGVTHWIGHELDLIIVKQLRLNPDKAYRSRDFYNIGFGADKSPSARQVAYSVRTIRLERQGIIARERTADGIALELTLADGVDVRVPTPEDEQRHLSTRATLHGQETSVGATGLAGKTALQGVKKVARTQHVPARSDEAKPVEKPATNNTGAKPVESLATTRIGKLWVVQRDTELPYRRESIMRIRNLAELNTMTRTLATKYNRTPANLDIQTRGRLLVNGEMQEQGPLMTDFWNCLLQDYLEPLLTLDEFYTKFGFGAGLLRSELVRQMQTLHQTAVLLHSRGAAYYDPLERSGLGLRLMYIRDHR